MPRSAWLVAAVLIPLIAAILYISDQTERSPSDSARPTREQAEAIVYVLQHAEGIRPTGVGSQADVAPAVQRYVDGLRAIDVSATPSDFQARWLEYVTANEALSAWATSVDTTRPAAELDREQAELSANVQAADEAMHRVAVRYGIRVSQ